MILFNYPKWMTDEDKEKMKPLYKKYEQLYKDIETMLNKWVKGDLDKPKEISKETMDKMANGILFVDFDNDGKIKDTILVDNLKIVGTSLKDVEDDLNTQFTIRVPAKKLPLSEFAKKYLEDKRKKGEM